VPDDAGLEIECYLQNKDIGFVKPDQEAVIKIESFPFTRFRTLDAQVLRVAKDAIPEPDAQQVEGNPAKANKSTFLAGAQRTQNLVFPTTLKPAATTINVDGIAVPLSPGMAVSVEIKTGSRHRLSLLTPRRDSLASDEREVSGIEI
jgi:hemolysin D